MSENELLKGQQLFDTLTYYQSKSEDIIKGVWLLEGVRLSQRDADALDRLLRIKDEIWCGEPLASRLNQLRNALYQLVGSTDPESDSAYRASLTREALDAALDIDGPGANIKPALVTADEVLTPAAGAAFLLGNALSQLEAYILHFGDSLRHKNVREKREAGRVAKFGDPRQKRAVAIKEYEKAIAEDLNEGAAQVRAAIRAGVSDRTVRRYIRDHLGHS